MTSMRTRPLRSSIATLAACTALAAGLTGATASSSDAVNRHRDAHAKPAAGLPGPLDLGPTGLTETRTTTSVQPGVTLTRITRGGTDAALFWTLEVLIAPTSSSPDPDAPPAVIADRASAEAEADRLRAEGSTRGWSASSSQPLPTCLRACSATACGSPGSPRR